MDGKVYEVDAAWLAGKRITLERSYLAPEEACVLFEGQRLALHFADPVRNARRKRKAMPKEPIISSPPNSPNPADVALEHMLDRPRPDKETR